MLKKHKVNVIRGWAQLIDGKTVSVKSIPEAESKGSKNNRGDNQKQAEAPVTHQISCEHLLLATGSLPVELPSLPFDGKRVISSTHALSPSQIPESLIVVGGGYIGLELDITYQKLGAQVSIVEAADRILPAYDAELTQPVTQRLAQLGIRLYLKHQVVGLSEKGLQLQPRDNETAEIQTLQANQILVAAGRKPNTEGWGLEKLPLERKSGALVVDNQCKTSMHNVWAIGDLTGEPMLAHRAMAQGKIVAEIIAGQKRYFEPDAIAAVCFTDPELVSVGLNPTQSQEAGYDIIQSQFPFVANARAMTLEDTSGGFVRVVADRKNHRILGWQAVGSDVSELATAFAQSLEAGSFLEDIAYTIHPHPTLGEAVQEAALRALGQALHI